ncbi:DUF2441 domain-containing protein [Vallitalea okinawensis]|uniref:DUF2441 domain-containing protein n=1 Tax=Vallitalea okinawensis TaxID=2078660 RepID=UPI000CFB457C|nr:DUF2441 domain-containing protein [Vallitalea okinawensis]
MSKNEQYFYHLVTNRKMTLGQTIHFDEKTKNTLYGFFFEKEFYNDKGEDVMDILKDNLTNEGISLNHEDANVIHSYIDNTSRSIRETIAELVRLSEYPEYPSRLSCLYAARNYEEVLQWKEIFESYNRQVLQIVKVVTDGVYFIGDGGLLPNIDAAPFSQKISQAREYWKGINDDILPEVLVNGRIKVLEIVEDFTDNSSSKRSVDTI